MSNMKRKAVSQDDTQKPKKRLIRYFTTAQKLDAITCVADGETRSSVSQRMGIPESTLRGWLKTAHKIQETYAHEAATSAAPKKRKKSVVPNTSDIFPINSDDEPDVMAKKTFLNNLAKYLRNSDVFRLDNAIRLNDLINPNRGDVNVTTSPTNVNSANANTEPQLSSDTYPTTPSTLPIPPSGDDRLTIGGILDHVRVNEFGLIHVEDS